MNRAYATHEAEGMGLIRLALLAPVLNTARRAVQRGRLGCTA